MTQTMATVEELEAELLRLPAQLEEAALAGDAAGFVALQMRRAAIPALIRERRTEPLREKLARLDDESDRLVEERAEALTAAPPEPPAALRGTVTPAMMRSRLLDGLARREENVSRERREVVARVAEIEAEL